MFMHFRNKLEKFTNFLWTFKNKVLKVHYFRAHRKKKIKVPKSKSYTTTSYALYFGTMLFSSPNIGRLDEIMIQMMKDMEKERSWSCTSEFQHQISVLLAKQISRLPDISLFFFLPSPIISLWIQI